jgi:hypothetical protein
MRSFVISTFALAIVLAPAVVFAQATTTPPPAGQQPPATAQAPAQPAAPAAPKLTFKTPAGILLVQVKPDQTAVFEEMIGKLSAGLPNAKDPAIKAEAGSWKFYRAAEPAAGGNVLYVVLIDPATANTEYQFYEVINSTLTDEQKRDPATAEMYKRWNAAIAGMNMLNITPVTPTSAGGGR